MHSLFNYSKLSATSSEATEHDKFVVWLNTQFSRLGQTLRGAYAFDAGVSGTAKALAPQLADLTKLQLTGNTTITLPSTQMRAGAGGDIELAQDATGSRTVTWVNVLNTPPTVTSTATKRTLLQARYNGSGWLLTLLASNY